MIAGKPRKPDDTTAPSRDDGPQPTLNAPLQRRLAVGLSDDPAEREAETAAQAVSRSIDPIAIRQRPGLSLARAVESKDLSKLSDDALMAEYQHIQNWLKSSGTPDLDYFPTLTYMEQIKQEITRRKISIPAAFEGSLTEHKQKVFEYKEGADHRWIDAPKIEFLKGAGFDVFLAAKKKGFSTFGALFIVAHASLESGWGGGNWAAKTNNLFSVMGGSNPKYKGAHGTLAEYPSIADAFDAYLALLGKSNRWPTTVAPSSGLYYKNSFIPDDVNQAFHQGSYYRKGGPAYNADPDSDYGESLFDRMQFLTGPLIVVVEKMAASATAGSEQARQLQQYVAELQAAYASIKQNLKAHRAAKKKKQGVQKRKQGD